MFALFQVRSSPPLRPPPSKMVSSFKRASAGPRVPPPPVTAFEIDLDVKVKESVSPSKSAAFACGAAASKSAVISRDILTTANPKYL